MSDDIEYRPDRRVVSSARAFITALTTVYGATQGMAVWDKIRESLGDQAASDIFTGILISDDRSVTISSFGPGNSKFEAIKAIRSVTGLGLRESKNFADDVMDLGLERTLEFNCNNQDIIDEFYETMRLLGAKFR